MTKKLKHFSQQQPLKAQIYSFPKRRSFEKSTGKYSKLGQQVTFNRQELNALLRVYGFKVARGEWRDYAIDHLQDRAVFSIFRHSSEVPLFQVEKIPALALKQGMYKVAATGGYIMRRGHELSQVLKVLEKSLHIL